MSKSNPTYPVINFMKYKWLYFTISACVILTGLFYLVSYGLNPAIDFTGGSLIEIQADPSINLTTDTIQQTAQQQNIAISSVQTSANNTFLIRTQPIDKEVSNSFQASLASPSAIATDSAQPATISAGLIQELQFATVGPTLGAELLRKTFFSVVLASIAILLFIAWRFKQPKYGFTAIAAMLHDTLILLGVFAILGRHMDIQVDTLFVTAVLTTLSFSVHDTIVVYDRIRETLIRYPKANFTDVVNKSIAETLARSINNSMTIIFMLLALWLLGGETIRWFVFALLIGTIAGTYSSTFTAAPLLDLWHSLSKKRASRK